MSSKCEKRPKRKRNWKNNTENRSMNCGRPRPSWDCWPVTRTRKWSEHNILRISNRFRFCFVFFFYRSIDPIDFQFFSFFFISFFNFCLTVEDSRAGKENGIAERETRWIVAGIGRFETQSSRQQSVTRIRFGFKRIQSRLERKKNSFIHLKFKKWNFFF